MTDHPGVGGIWSMPRTSMSDLSRPSGFGMDVRTRTACVPGSTRLEMYSTFPWSFLVRNGNWISQDCPICTRSRSLSKTFPHTQR